MPKKIIYAEDAIDAICKACSIVGDYHKCDGYPETSTWCDELVALRALPSAQPEIIRCRECKHYYYADNRIPQEQMCVCDLDGDRWSPDSYCSFAERKEDE